MRRRPRIVADLAAPLHGAAWLAAWLGDAALAFGSTRLALACARAALRLMLWRDLAVDNPERVARGRALLIDTEET